MEKLKKHVIRLFAAAVAVIMLLVPFQVVSYASDKDIEVITLGTPSHAWWETDTIAKWHSVSKAHEYQVKLYIADDVDVEFDEDTGSWKYEYFDDDEQPEAVAVVRTGETSYDFSPYMSDLHSYFFVVRATPKVNEQAYVKNGAWKVSPEIDYRGKTVQGITTGKWRNYLEGSRYDISGDGEREFLGDGWQLIRGKWYYLANGGYRQNGWLSLDGQNYYLGEDGALSTGWFYLNDAWYYADSTGAIQTGWVMPVPGKYYYLYDDGRMAADTFIDGYYVDSTGLRASTSESTRVR